MANYDIVAVAKQDLFTAQDELSTRYPESVASHILRLRDLYNWYLANPESADKVFVTTASGSSNELTTTGEFAAIGDVTNIDGVIFAILDRDLGSVGGICSLLQVAIGEQAGRVDDAARSRLRCIRGARHLHAAHGTHRAHRTRWLRRHAARSSRACTADHVRCRC